MEPNNCDNCGISFIEVLGGDIEYCPDCDMALCPRCYGSKQHACNNIDYDDPDEYSDNCWCHDPDMEARG